VLSTAFCGLWPPRARRPSTKPELRGTARHEIAADAVQRGIDLGVDPLVLAALVLIAHPIAAAFSSRPLPQAAAEAGCWPASTRCILRVRHQSEDLMNATQQTLAACGGLLTGILDLLIEKDLLTLEEARQLILRTARAPDLHPEGTRMLLSLLRPLEDSERRRRSLRTPPGE